ncbi:DUF2157 domain-containing protein [Pseudomonadota bacterium]|nr:DUF2157 domain-containing protein [Pseudomonadota bacterium]
MMSLLILVVILLLIGGGIWIWPLAAGILGIASVTDKPSALKNIAQLMNTYDITSAEVDTAFHDLTSNNTASTSRSKSDITKTLFTYLGAIFILAGISTYIGMFWDSMGSTMRIFVTLGVAYILLIVLISALYEKKFPRLILPLTLANVMMMTAGWFVLVDETFPHNNNWQAAALFVFGIMALHQALIFSKFQRTVLAFTSLFFIYGFMNVGLDMLGIPLPYIAIILGASVFLMGVALESTAHRSLSETALLIGSFWMNSGLFDHIAMFTAANWASMVIGISLMLTAYGLQKSGRYDRLVGLAYFIGSLMMYSGLFDLVENTAVELLYFAVTASMLYACVVLQSRALLLTTVIAMLSFFGYYSVEYFTNSLGWPVTLVILGIIFLGVGTIAIKVKKRIEAI